jgi:choline dehydrogenase
MKKRDAHSRNTANRGNISRRTFAKRLAAAGISTLAAPLIRGSYVHARPVNFTVDYIVVGGGAGGGPVAARLAKAGFTVALLEAGLDPKGQEVARLDPFVSLFYDVPALFSVAAEHPLLGWDFYVKHYSDPVQQARNSKHVPGKGILYPRGSALGGSTAVNAMVMVYPHDRDFDDIADATGDRSWRASNMRRYFEMLERCDYCEFGAPGRGFNGYIPVNHFDEQAFDLYPELRDLAEAGQTIPSSYLQGNTARDVNHPLVAAGDTGAFRSPMHSAFNVRVAIRDYLATVAHEHPGQLILAPQQN